QGRRRAQRPPLGALRGADALPGRARPGLVPGGGAKPARGRSPCPAARPDDGSHLPRPARGNRTRAVASAGPAHFAYAGAQAVACLENLGQRRVRRGAPAVAHVSAASGMRVAVVGAGWAGLAAATRLHDAGCAVTVYEAGRVPGGRARRVAHDGGASLDNGQHILLGAYTETLALMRRLGRDPQALFLRTRLCLERLDGSFRLAAPDLPAPLHAAAALAGARGLSLDE